VGRIVRGAALLVPLVYFHGPSATERWRPAALDQSIAEIRLVIDQAARDSDGGYHMLADLWSMRRVQAALQKLNATR
jgi:hypothetical protein